MNNSNFDKEYQEYLAILIDKEGNVQLLLPEDPSLEQDDLFLKVVAVTTSPSIVLKTILYIELLLIKMQYIVKSLFYKEK
jgi:hypothetical protein